MAELSEVAKMVYLHAGGNHCPFCASANISGEELEVAGKNARGEVRCDDCGKRWQDVYDLVGVEAI